METKFKTINEDNFDEFRDYWYGGGNKLKFGDKIVFGYTINYANLYGIPPARVHKCDAGLSLQIFVLNEIDNMIYQLYKLID